MTVGLSPIPPLLNATRTHKIHRVALRFGEAKVARNLFGSFRGAGAGSGVAMVAKTCLTSKNNHHDDDEERCS